MTTKISESEIKQAVQEHYAALVADEEESKSCCASASCCESSGIEETLKGNFAALAGYTEEQVSQIPEDAVENSFGCGNPLALAEIKEGDVVLDLGSGAGIDVLLASKRVGPNGKAIGVDMTLQMIAKARKNAAKRSTIRSGTLIWRPRSGPWPTPSKHAAHRRHPT